MKVPSDADCHNTYRPRELPSLATFALTYIFRGWDTGFIFAYAYVDEE